jgi:hypothetical protein
MVTVFENVSLPDIDRLSRRTVFSALVVGVVGLIICVIVGYPLAALGLAIGISVGITNFRAIQKSVAKIGRRAGENKRRPLAMNTLGRMGIISVIAMGLLFLSFPLGFGVLGGLAIFQMLLLVNVTRSMLSGEGEHIVDGESWESNDNGTEA